MAQLHITDHALTVELTWWEKIAARRSDLTVPLRVIDRVETFSDVSEQLEGDQSESGMRVEGMTCVGTFSTQDGSRRTTFAVCHGRRPGVVIHLNGATVDRIVISTDSARHYAAQLAQYAVDS